MSEEVVKEDTCTHCGSTLVNDAPICYQCGKPTVPPEEWEGAYERYRLLVGSFYGLNFLICLVFNFVKGVGDNIAGLVAVDGLLLGLAVFYAWQMRTELAPLILKWNRFSWWKVIVLVIVAVSSAVIVNYGVKWINRSIFDRELYYYSSFQDLMFPKTIMLLLIAIIPAFSEELAYRGVIQAGLLKITHTRLGVVFTALLFAIIHMSLISFFWLLPFALFLGWLRQRTQTLWYGILVHFCFNATACILEFRELGLL